MTKTKHINKAILVGTLKFAPEIRNFQNGKKQARFPIITEDSNNKIQWHNIVVNKNSCAVFCERNITQGDDVQIEGKIISRKYTDKFGRKKSTTEILITEEIGEINKHPSALHSESLSCGSCI